LTDLTASPGDDIQAQLDAGGGGSNVDAQLAAMKAQLATGDTQSSLPTSEATPSAPDAPSAPTDQES
jgi:phage shock protein A